MQNFKFKSSAKEAKSAIDQFYLINEDKLVGYLLSQIPQQIDWQKIKQDTISLINNARADKKRQTLMDCLLNEYSLSNREGILLMCLAEALIRIPDQSTAEKFIHSILNSGNWQSHLQKDQPLLINASTWALMFGEKISSSLIQPNIILKGLISRIGLGSMRSIIKQSLTIIAKQFVLSTQIENALTEAKKEIKSGYIYTFDMLGEAALSDEDAEIYYKKYLNAIDYLGKNNHHQHSVSVKLSALYPRYEYRQKKDVLNFLYHRIENLVLAAIKNNIALSIDAEEADRLILSLDLIEKLLNQPKINQWKKLGVVVQAYSKRCLWVLNFLVQLAKEKQTQIPVRLVKGAYWDNEIKHAQQLGLKDFPVFTHKCNTDLNYLIAADFLFKIQSQKYLIPQFATHNAHTICAIKQMGENKNYEFQKLHGMGEVLYAQILQSSKINCRIYAPIGQHQYLLPYLVRRLLENGANTSFVNRLIDEKMPAKKLAIHPQDEVKKNEPNFANSKIKKAKEIYAPRKNSWGINQQNSKAEKLFKKIMANYSHHKWQAQSLIVKQKNLLAKNLTYYCPFDLDHSIAQVKLLEANQKFIDNLYQNAQKAYQNQQTIRVEKRALHLLKLADLLELHKEELIALCVYEAGKVFQDAVDEIREAVDFCRYYAHNALTQFANKTLPSCVGENNQLIYSGKGVFLCISPWNFPLAIFTGQVVASYVSGNAVIAKPSPLTPTIAHKAVQLMYEAGIDPAAIQLVLCQDEMNNQLTAHQSLNSVMFTGSTQTANKIQKNLVNRTDCPIATLVAETGGLNAMIIDSTALAEQVVIDIIQSAFQSAGQRCSALRIACIQKSIYPQILKLLKGVLAKQKVGECSYFSTDIGPVINQASYQKINTYIKQMKEKFKYFTIDIQAQKKGFYISPHIFEIKQFTDVKQEIFGPILHVVSYDNDNLDQVIDDINNSGYGLTLGIHTRNQQTAQYIAQKANVGNIYINRNQIGAIVGSQPFGGRGFSGTGPKAGGPNYLTRLVDEKTISNNIAAIGGNPDLLGN